MLKQSFTMLMIGSVVIVAAAITPVQAEPMMDGQITIIPERHLSEISSELENASTGLAIAQALRQRANTNVQAVTPRIEAKKREIDIVGQRLKDAEKMKDGSTVIALKTEKRSQEQVRKILEQFKTLRKAELETAETEQDLAGARIQALELEIELAKKRMEVDSLRGAGVTGLNLQSAMQVAYQLENRTLQAQKTVADRTQKLAERQRKVVEHRLKLYEERSKIAIVGI